MFRSSLFADLARLVRLANHCDARDLPTPEGIERARARAAQTTPHLEGRREWLQRVGRTAAAGAVAAIAAPGRDVFALARRRDDPSVGIVGAGLAGLACADRLKAGGLRAALYDAGTRTAAAASHCAASSRSGRRTRRRVHRQRAQDDDRLRATVQSDLEERQRNKEPGDILYFSTAEVPESVIVENFRDFAAIMRDNLKKLSRQITAIDH